MIKKRIVGFFLASILLVSACGCKQSGKLVKKYDAGLKKEKLSSQTVCSNDRFELLWNDEVFSVSLKDKQTQKVWSNIPIEYQEYGMENMIANSTLRVTVLSNKNGQWFDLDAYNDAAQSETIYSTKMDKGLKVTYCFEQYKVSVSVNYILREDSLLVSVDSADIHEEDSNTVYSVSLAPFLASAKNNTLDSYLFVPSGSGALMTAKETADLPRSYSGDVFGSDPAQSRVVNVSEEDHIYLPVFGAKEENDAIFGIIEESAESANIKAECGNDGSGYSNVYASFYVRGYDRFSSSRDGSGSLLMSDEKSDRVMSVGFYPLTGENADYNGMAKCYQDYLLKNQKVQHIDNPDSPYSLTLIGGTQTTSAKGGIPHSVYGSMTTFLQAEEIIKSVSEKVGKPAAVRMVGFGKTGIITGELAGGFAFANDAGNKKDRLSLQNYCKNNSMQLYFDYDLVRFGKSGNGFSTISDVTKTPSLRQIKLYTLNLPLRDKNNDLLYRLLKRSEMPKAVDKLIKHLNKSEVTGVSLETLSSIAYSDYGDKIHNEKENMANEVSVFFNKIKKAGVSLASVNANSYAATASDYIFNVPLESGSYNGLEWTIPFYQLVFSGLRPMTSSAINTAAVPEKELMLAASCGIGLNFTLIHDFDVSYMEMSREKIYSAVYTEQLDTIAVSLAKYFDLYKKIKDSSIKSYNYLSNVVTETVFENGITVYANHSSIEVSTPSGKLSGYDFMIKEMSPSEQE